MLVAAKLVQTHGGTLTVCDANATVTEVMEISGMARLLRLCSTEEDAIAAFTRAADVALPPLAGRAGGARCQASRPL
jgi:hypothetical protein